MCGKASNNFGATNRDYYCDPGNIGTSAPDSDDDTTAVTSTYKTSYTTESFSGRTLGSAAGSLQSYLTELDKFDKFGSAGTSTINDPGSRRWVYPQDTDPTTLNTLTPNYITVRAIIRDRRVTDSSGNFASPPDYPTGTSSKKPELRADMSVIDSGSSVPSIKALFYRADRLTIGFCVTDSYYDSTLCINSTCPPPTGGYSHRGCTSASSASSSEGQIGIQFIMRNARIPLTKYAAY